MPILEKHILVWNTFDCEFYLFYLFSGRTEFIQRLADVLTKIRVHVAIKQSTGNLL